MLAGFKIVALFCLPAYKYIYKFINLFILIYTNALPDSSVAYTPSLLS